MPDRHFLVKFYIRGSVLDRTDMGVSRNFPGEQCQHFANPCQVADDAMQIYVHETLNLFYTSKP